MLCFLELFLKQIDSILEFDVWIYEDDYFSRAACRVYEWNQKKTLCKEFAKKLPIPKKIQKQFSRFCCTVIAEAIPVAFRQVLEQKYFISGLTECGEKLISKFASKYYKICPEDNECYQIKYDSDLEEIKFSGNQNINEEYTSDEYSPYIQYRMHVNSKKDSKCFDCIIFDYDCFILDKEFIPTSLSVFNSEHYYIVSFYN